MAYIIRNLPFYETPTLLQIPGGPVVPLKHHQIIVWVSVTKPGLKEFQPTALRFPAVFDTGFNCNFLIREQHLIEWAGVMPHDLQWVDLLTADQQPIPQREADVWIHLNLAGRRDELTDHPPFRLELDHGIAIWPATLPGARRLPLLGIRGLKRAALQVHIDCRRSVVSMRTPRRFWFFN